MTASPRTLPRSLRASIRKRELIRTGKIRWLEEVHLSAIPPYDREPNAKPITKLYEGRWSGDDYIVTHFGDKDGVMFYDEEGKPARSFNNCPLSTMYLAGEKWRTHEGWCEASILPFDHEHRHPRELAMPNERLLKQLNSMASSIDEKSQPDGNFVVTLRSEKMESEFEIDPTMDFAIVRTTTRVNGKKIDEALVEFDRTDSVWFPSKIRIRRFVTGEQGEESREWMNYDVQLAEFNRSTHERRLSPESIGVDAGFTVMDRRPGKEPGIYAGPKYGVVTRASPVSIKALTERGEYQPGAKYLALRKRIELLSTFTDCGDDIPDERYPFQRRWRQDVRYFIQSNDLRPNQREQAESILADCTRRALDYRRLKNPDYRRIRDMFERENGLTYAPPRPRGVTDLTGKALSDAIAALDRPIDDIRDKDLLPRLHAILGDDQVKARDEREKSRADRRSTSASNAP